MARFVPKPEALANPSRASMLAWVAQRPGIGLSELAAGLAVTPSTVLWHARKLAAADLVRMQRCGRRRLFYPTAAAARDLNLPTLPRPRHGAPLHPGG